MEQEKRVALGVQFAGDTFIKSGDLAFAIIQSTEANTNIAQTEGSVFGEANQGELEVLIISAFSMLIQTMVTMNPIPRHRIPQLVAEMSAEALEKVMEALDEEQSNAI